MTEPAIEVSVQPPAHLTEKGRDSWHRRRRQEQQRLTRLAECKREFQRHHEEWRRLREHYRDNEPACAVLDGHEPSLDEGGGWAIRMPVIVCDVCYIRDDTGGRWGTWPCWTYELLAGMSAGAADGGNDD